MTKNVYTPKPGDQVKGKCGIVFRRARKEGTVCRDPDDPDRALVTRFGLGIRDKDNRFWVLETWEGIG